MDSMAEHLHEIDMAATFKEIDSDTDGRVTVAELAKHMKSKGFISSEDDIKHLLPNVDEDELDRKVSLIEYLDMMDRAFSGIDLKGLRQDFDRYDMDKDGVLSKDDFKAYFEQFGEDKSEKELKEMLGWADDNRDGKVTFEEFAYMRTRENRGKNWRGLNDISTEYLTSYFKKMDIDDDGYLTVEELGKEMKAKYYIESEDEIIGELKIADLDSDGKVSLQEYLSMMERSLMGLDIKVMRTDFDYYDMDSDGIISKDDLQQYYEHFEGEKKTNKQLEEMIGWGDEDGDGKITFEEYVYMVTRQSRC